MKKILFIALVAFFGSGFSTHAQTFTDKLKKKHTYTKSITSEVTVDDGKKLIYKGASAVTATQVKTLYDASLNNTLPPVVLPPVIKWDIYTPENLAKMVALKDTYVKIKPSTKPYSGQNELKEFNNVTIDLGASEGVVWSPWDISAFVLKGNTNGLHFINGNVKNTNQAFVKYDYLGAQYLNDITFDNITFEKTGAIFDSQGGYKDDPDQFGLGIINNFKATNLVIKNSPGQGTFFVLKGDNFLFDNIKMDNIGTTTGEHVHAMILMGRGKISNNVLTNHRGSLFRLTSYNIFPDTTQKTIVTNNIVDNSTRYGAFEVFWTSEASMKTSTWHTAKVEIYNNTIGRLGFTDKTWENTVVDVYDSHCWVVVYNNLCYQMFSINNPTNPNLINYASRDGNDPTVRQFNNIYVPTWQGAIKSLTNFESLFPGIGYKSN